MSLVAQVYGPCANCKCICIQSLNLQIVDGGILGIAIEGQIGMRYKEWMVGSEIRQGMEDREWRIE